MRVLVVEDHEALADGIARSLQHAGYAVDVIADGEEADDILRTQEYGLVVLDLNLPGMDGLEILKRLRDRQSECAVLILTARNNIDDRVRGLDLGADDYLAKPFELVELEARVRALMRRHAGTHNTTLRCGILSYDTVARRAMINDQDIDIPRRELAILETLLLRAGHVISKDQIADQLAGFDDDLSGNAVELYISRLRKRLEPAGIRIQTVRGLGYLLKKP
ncbi:response regulator transcription factor [Thalassospira sp.]|uniref:response regulator n=1 Tax=Thalassospira sp. TaxID=1912094 RepID=UPI002735DEA8|nr:response regulator transcription factor [Thalassospira sp.]MDP2698439.1 response regulator transcription factor [Thalassospira sp.]